MNRFTLLSYFLKSFQDLNKNMRHARSHLSFLIISRFEKGDTSFIHCQLGLSKPMFKIYLYLTFKPFQDFKKNMRHTWSPAIITSWVTSPPLLNILNREDKIWGGSGLACIQVKMSKSFVLIFTLIGL